METFDQTKLKTVIVAPTDCFDDDGDGDDDDNNDDYHYYFGCYFKIMKN